MASMNDPSRIEQPRIRPARSGELSGQNDKNAVPLQRMPSPGPSKSTLPLVAEHDGRVVAGVSLTLSEDRCALIHSLWIEKEWEDSDLVLRMMVTVLEQCKNLGGLKVDMDPCMKGLAICAMLLDRGLLMDAPGGDQTRDEPSGRTSSYPNLHKQASSVFA